MSLSYFLHFHQEIYTYWPDLAETTFDNGGNYSKRNFQPGDIPSEQPIVGNGLAVVCNGEIYNHKEIKVVFS